MNGKEALAKANPLVKDVYWQVWHSDFKYCSVVGMLLHISGHLHQDLKYTVNCPRQSHKQVLKRTGKNLVAFAIWNMIFLTCMSIRKTSNLHVSQLVLVSSLLWLILQAKVLFQPWIQKSLYSSTVEVHCSQLLMWLHLLGIHYIFL